MPVNFLTKAFRWVFAILDVLAVFVAVAIIVVMAIDPKMPAGLHFGPVPVEIMGQPGSFVLRAVNRDSDFTLTALRGSLLLFVHQAGGLIEVLKHYALPLLLIRTIFLAIMFDLLRRLFRNVGRGESFTPQSVRLVQTVGGALIVYSLVWRLPMPGSRTRCSAISRSTPSSRFPGHRCIFPRRRARHFRFRMGFPSATARSYSGLLVLALSEVFRQGLALKNENDLTV